MIERGALNRLFNYITHTRWTVVYPAYINAKKTQAQGRRIPKSKVIVLIIDTSNFVHVL